MRWRRGDRVLVPLSTGGHSGGTVEVGGVGCAFCLVKLDEFNGAIQGWVTPTADTLLEYVLCSVCQRPGTPLVGEAGALCDECHQDHYVDQAEVANMKEEEGRQVSLAINSSMPWDEDEVDSAFDVGFLRGDSNNALEA